MCTFNVPTFIVSTLYVPTMYLPSTSNEDHGGPLLQNIFALKDGTLN